MSRERSEAPLLQALGPAAHEIASYTRWVDAAESVQR
jgi:hypothetical protein